MIIHDDKRVLDDTEIRHPTNSKSSHSKLNAQESFAKNNTQK